MKKMIMFAMAAAMVLCIASCSKAQFPEGARKGSNLRLNISVADLAKAGTKAVKTGWAAGDSIYIWYDANTQQTPDLVIVYDGTDWEKASDYAFSGNTPSASGTLNAIYIGGEGLSAFNVYNDGGFYNHKDRVGSLNNAVAMPLMAMAEKVGYTCAEQTLTAELGWSFGKVNNIQVVVTGLPEGEWALRCDKSMPITCFKLSEGGFATTTETAKGYYALPVANADGQAFYFQCTDVYSAEDFAFTLYDITNGKEYSYTAKGKEVDITGGKLNAVRIAAAKFGISEPDNALPGLFSVGDGKQVRFAKGNLKYDLGSKKWGFFDRQYECDPGTDDTFAEGYISLFCWGYDAEKSILPEAYESNSEVSEAESDFTYAEDWGSALEPGKGWRTLTAAEWQYLFSHEWLDVDYDNDARRGMYRCGVTVMGSLNCIVLYPDGYSEDKMVEDDDEEAFDTEEEYLAATEAGIVFLPAAGMRTGDEVVGTGKIGNYWSCTTAFESPEEFSYGPYFTGWEVIPDSNSEKVSGLSVRLVVDK